MGKGAVTIGYKYSLGMQQILCLAPIDSITKLIVDQVEGWVGNVTATTRIHINQPNLFGGEKSEGGIVGDYDIEFGDMAQMPNDYLSSVTPAPYPAYRGVVQVVQRHAYCCSMAAYPKDQMWKGTNIIGKSLDPTTANINGAVNAAHIIYGMLTSYGLQYTDANINLASFRASATQLYAESFGLSFLLTDTDNLDTFIQGIVTCINGALYIDSTGKFALDLLRQDYDPSTLPILDQNNIIDIASFTRPTYAEMCNEIIVTYNPQGELTGDSVTVQDLGSIQMQGSTVSKTNDYPGIDSTDLANRVAWRDLQQNTVPAATIKMTVNRGAWNIPLGKAFKLTWPDYGIVELICRVTSIDTGQLTSGTITIQAQEDIWGMPLTTYMGLAPTSWTNPVQPSVPAPYRDIFEGSYRDCAHFMTSAQVSALTGTESFLSGVVGDPGVYYRNWDAYVNAGPGYVVDASGTFCPHGPISAAMAIADTTTIIVAFIGQIANFAVGGYAMIDSEAVQVTAINVTTGAVTIGRGCLDTIPAAHASGARMYFVDGYQLVDQAEYVQGESILVKAAMNSGSALDITTLPADTVVMIGRQGRPYPPAKFRINGTQYPTTVTGALTLTWNERNRILTADQIINTEAATQVAETNQRYGIQCYNSGGTLLIQRLDISGQTAAIVLNYTGTVTVKLFSINDNNPSWQTYIASFSYTPPGGTTVSSITAPTYTPTIYVLDGGGA